MKYLNFLLVASALHLSTVALAQDEGGTSSTNSSQNELDGKHALAIQGGVIGFGLEYAYNINSQLNLRLGANLLTLDGISIPYELDGREVDVIAGANAFNVDLFLEYLPFDRSSFKLVGGLAYVNNTGGNATLKLKDGLNYGDIVLNPDDVGTIDLKMNYTGIAPYIGFGFGRAVPKKRVGFGVEFGTYYVGGPDISLIATELLEPSANEQEEAKLEEAFSSFAWLPNIKLKLAVRL